MPASLATGFTENGLAHTHVVVYAVMGLQRTQVILVEDDPDTRDLLAELLQEQFDVRTAESAETAMSEMNDRPADVIITDQTLPGTPGTQLATDVKARYPGTTVILVSGHSQIPNAQSCDLILPKPIDFERLSEAVAAH
ncbi:MAG: response regulator [Myxococcaceae bacterium]